MVVADAEELEVLEVAHLGRERHDAVVTQHELGEGSHLLQRTGTDLRDTIVAHVQDRQCRQLTQHLFTPRIHLHP